MWYPSLWWRAGSLEVWVASTLVVQLRPGSVVISPRPPWLSELHYGRALYEFFPGVVDGEVRGRSLFWRGHTVPLEPGRVELDILGDLCKDLGAKLEVDR